MLSFVLLSAGLALFFLALLISLVLTLSKARVELPASEPSRVLASRLLASRAHNASSPTESIRSPREPAPRRPLCVCAGDSLTHGVVSVNYVDILARRLGDWDFSNAGINSELAFNLADRLEPIIALDPEAVSVLIGTNDINATFGLRTALGYYALQHLPERPNPLFYRENLTLIVRRLKRETRARIALLSMPPIGEDRNHYAWLRTEEYALIVREVAKAEEVEYLPLRERICAYLESIPGSTPLPFDKFAIAGARAGRAHLLFGKSLDEISASNGFHVLVDGIHMNTHGASIAADLIEGFLRSGERGKKA